MQNEETKKPQGSSLEVFLTLGSVVQTNAPLIKEKASKALAVLTQIVKVDTKEQDELANAVLVKCSATLTAIQKLRKEYTGKLNDWIKDQMISEKELEYEIERVKTLRNRRANEEAAKAREAADKIEKERVYKAHEVELKQAIKINVELGVQNKVMELETWAAKMFGSATLENYKDIEAKLSVKPKLKTDFFSSLFDVNYDPNIIPADDFEALQDRAKKYFDYEHINKTYADTCNEILSQWKGLIPARVKELEAIAKGGEKAELIRWQAEQREREANEARQEAAKQNIESIKTKANEEAQEGILKVEFEAQIKSQEIEELKGVRRKRSFRIEPDIEKNMVKLSSFIGRLIIHVMSVPDIKGIHLRDAQGFPKLDAKGNAMYVDGIQYWLDQMEKVKHASMIEGLIMTEEVSTIAKK